MTRHSLSVLLVGLVLSITSHAQSACSPGALAEAAKAVAAARHQLHEQAVEENDPQVPPAIASQLAELKSNLVAAANAVFACAGPSASPEQLQTKLADALHANLDGAAETTILTKGKKDLGAYGSDLAVQVLPLYNSPRYLEVNFRYGIECGDDNLLLVFQAGDPGSAPWHEVLRWGAPKYSTVADAYGDFVLLTPLSGFPGQRNWRFVVAHGQPGCDAKGASHFDLDLLQPTADPSAPQVVWHLEHPYARTEVPRLTTTEDTLTFQVSTPEDPKARNGSSSLANIYRFHVSKDNQVEPLIAAQANDPTRPASTNSPQ